MTEVKIYVRDSAFGTLSLIEPMLERPQEYKSELFLVWMLTTGLHESSGSQPSQLKKVITNYGL